MKSRIMYIEHKLDGLIGHARIGRVTYSKSGRTIYYGGKAFRHYPGSKSNYREVTTNEQYWITGCKKQGGDWC